MISFKKELQIYETKMFSSHKQESDRHFEEIVIIFIEFIHLGVSFTIFTY